MKIIDSHAHYSHYKFEQSFPFLSLDGVDLALHEGTREDVLEAIAAEGVRAYIDCGIDIPSNEKILNSCDTAGEVKVYPVVGAHPTRCIHEALRDRKKLPVYASDSRVVAIGETGLDYHYPRKEQRRLRQLVWFLYQLRLADKRALPLVLHIRQADRDALRVLRLFKGHTHGGVVHCFSSGLSVAEEFVSLGFHLGIGGALLQGGGLSKKLEEVVKCIPLEWLIVETDAPYVLPKCEGVCSKKRIRKLRNTSVILPKVIERIAELKGMDKDTVAEAIYANTVETFRLRD